MIEEWLAPRGQVFLMNDPAKPGRPTVVLHPSTMMEMKHGGRTPLWTRHMAGVREAERDGRKQRRKTN